MNNLRLVALVVLCNASCAADPDGPSLEALPVMATRALDRLPGANYVSTFVPGQLGAQPDARARAAESIGWESWTALAAHLNLDAFEDASMVAATAFVGSCGANDGVVVVAPSGDPQLFSARVGAAVDVWRHQHPAPADDEAGAPARPELHRWVLVADGRCTIVQLDDFQSVAVTLGRAGVLELRVGLSGIACLPESKDELPAEALDETWLAGRALATGWNAGASHAVPAMVEAMPGGSEVTWVGGQVSTARFDSAPSP